RKEDEAACARWRLVRKRGQRVIAVAHSDVAPPPQGASSRERHPHYVVSARKRMAEGMQATQRVDHRLVAVGEDDSARADRRADGAGADDAIADRAGGVVTAA